jgi:hypothetical protein
VALLRIMTKGTVPVGFLTLALKIGFDFFFFLYWS